MCENEILVMEKELLQIFEAAFLSQRFRKPLLYIITCYNAANSWKRVT